MSKGFLGVIAAVIVIFAAFFIFGGNKANAPNKGSSGTAPTQHVEGQGKSGVKLIEYGDYQCPYCGEAYPVLKQVFSDLQSQIYFQFRNFPLVNDHPNAFAAARAAEAAGLQGKFWQMHDLLYDQNVAYYNGGQPANSWPGAKDPTPYFNADAAQLGLDVNKFKTDYASIKVNDLINADEAAGTKANVQATPTFILDGKQVSLPYQKGAKAVETVINNVISSKNR